MGYYDINRRDIYVQWLTFGTILKLACTKSLFFAVP